MTNVTLTPVPPAAGPVLDSVGHFVEAWSGWFRNLYNFLKAPTWTGTSVFSSPFVLPKYTVATLPAGSEGMLAMVTDATLTAITGLGVAPTGGGVNHVPVYRDNVGWKII